MYYFTYKTVDIETGNYYLGKHRTPNLEDGYLGSGTILKRMIASHGVERFERIILEFFDSYQEMTEAEKVLVSTHLSNPLCWNLRPGGDGGDATSGRIWINKEGREKRVFSDELDNFVNSGWCLGQDRQKAKLRNLPKKNHKHWINLETGEQRMAENCPGTGFTRGRKFVIRNKHIHTEAERENLAKKARECHLGKPKPGTAAALRNKVWISKDGETKRVDKQLLEPFLLEGWVLGRSRGK